jgi:translation initiation factor 2 beta subunit (eIF-2beta)/eIF-5
MSHATSAPPGASPPPLRAEARYRVIFHAHVCPGCGSGDITESEVETGDGITEIALTCQECGTAWPVACVVEWSTQP